MESQCVGIATYDLDVRIHSVLRICGVICSRHFEKFTRENIKPSDGGCSGDGPPVE